MGFLKGYSLRLPRISFVVREHYYEKRLGIVTIEPRPIKYDTSLYKDAVLYQPTPYSILERMMVYLQLKTDDVFIDLGCGEGRVIFFVARQKLKKVVGVECNEELVDLADRNLHHLKLNTTPIEIIHADAATFDGRGGTVFFMFNPFGPQTLTRVIDNLKDILATHPRKIRIVYYSAAHRNLLDNQDWLISEGEISDTGIFVWHNRLS